MVYLRELQDDVSVDVEIYYLLWKAQAHVRIPTTVIYRYGKVESWFFNAMKSGLPCVMRKRLFTLHQSGIVERIEEALGGHTRQPHEVVAVWTAVPRSHLACLALDMQCLDT